MQPATGAPALFFVAQGVAVKVCDARMLLRKSTAGYIKKALHKAGPVTKLKLQLQRVFIIAQQFIGNAALGFFTVKGFCFCKAFQTQ